MVLVDTNVLVDIVQDDPLWADWSTAQLTTQATTRPLAINPVIYAELSLSFSTLESLDRWMTRLRLSWHEVPRTALFLAGQAFARYRRQGGSRPQVLPDFLIGAHAAVQGWSLLTRDARRFRTYFPTLDVIAP